MAANARQVRDGLARLGITGEDVERFLRSSTIRTPSSARSVLIAAWGKRAD